MNPHDAPQAPPPPFATPVANWTTALAAVAVATTPNTAATLASLGTAANPVPVPF